MPDILFYDDLADYVDHCKLVASDARNIADRARADLCEHLQALVNVGHDILYGGPVVVDEIENVSLLRLVKEARAFKQIAKATGELQSAMEAA